MKNRAIKGIPHFLLALLIVLITAETSLVIGIITTCLFYGIAVTFNDKKKPVVYQDTTYVQNQWVYVNGNRKRVN